MRLERPLYPLRATGVKWSRRDGKTSILVSLQLHNYGMFGYPMENVESYTTLCTLQVDPSRLPVTYKRKVSGRGMYYSVNFDIVLLFGLTELQAMVTWKEKVSPFLYYWVIASILFTELSTGCRTTKSSEDYI